jgi:hypothetical protein
MTETYKRVRALHVAVCDLGCVEVHCNMQVGRRMTAAEYDQEGHILRQEPLLVWGLCHLTRGMNAALVPGCSESHQEKDAGEDVGDVQGQEDSVQHLAEVLHLRDLSHTKDS